MKYLRALTICATCLVIGSQALAAPICFEPRAPSIYAMPPSKPYCARSGKGCSQWEIDSYNREVRSHFDSLRTYLDEVESYRKKAYDYARCMADLD